MKQKTITQYHNINASAPPYAVFFHKSLSAHKSPIHLTLLNNFITNPFISNQLKNAQQSIIHKQTTLYNLTKYNSSYRTNTLSHYCINQLTNKITLHLRPKTEILCKLGKTIWRKIKTVSLMNY